MKKRFAKEIGKLLFYILPIAILLFLCTYHLGDNLCIKICGDEFGYWAAGSYFAGYDWSEIMSLNGYHGWGYGIILAFFLKCTKSQVTAYQAALILNSIFCCVIFLLAFRIMRKRSVETNEGRPMLIDCIASFAVSVYTANLCYSQYTLCETLLAVLYWLMVYMVYLLAERVTLVRIIIFYFLACYSFTVHMRTIGVLFICILFGIFLGCKNKRNWKYVFIGLLFVMFGLLVSIAVKSRYKEAYFDKLVVSSVGNELAGQIATIQYLFTGEGIISAFRGFIGKLFYGFTSSFLILGIAFAAFFHHLLHDLQKRTNGFRISQKSVPLIFMVFSVLAEMVIASVYMIHYGARFDMLTYGRYFEYTLTPLLLFGLAELYKGNYLSKKTVSTMLVFYLWTAIYVNRIQDYNLAKGNIFANTSGLFILRKINFEQNSFLAIALFCVLVIVAIYILTDRRKGVMKDVLFSVCVIGISVCWIYEAKYCYEEACLNWSYSMNSAELSLADEIRGLGIEDELYFYLESNYLKADVLQYILKEHTIHVTDTIEKKHMTDISYILTVDDTGKEKELKALGFRLIGHSEWLKLWGREGS